MMKNLLLFALFLFAGSQLAAQVLFYEDDFTGGVTGGGYSPAYNTGGIGNFSVYIEPGSTIHKAYLMAGRHGNAANLTVTLNGNPFTFNNTNQVSPTFVSTFYGGNSGTHAIDVTAFINPATVNYTLDVPIVGGPSNRYNDFYLYIAYDNPSLQAVSTAIFVNNIDFADLITFNNINVINPFQTSAQIGVMLFTGYICSPGDDDDVSLNGVPLGTIYGPDVNSGSCGGPVANFYYQNSTVFGLGDDNADQAMNAADLTSNAQAIIVNNSTSFTLEFTTNTSNARWALILAYASSDSLPLTANASVDTSVCAGGCANVSVSVSGGSAPYTYTWTPNIGNGPGPYSVCPTTTTTYIVLVTDSVGNTAMDSMTVTVNSLPVILISSPSPICVGDSTLLTATGATLYTWSPCTDLNPCTGSAVMASPSISTPYTVTGMDANGCSATASVTVTVNPLPLVVSPPAPSVCVGGSVVLTMSGAQYYRWSPQTGLSNPNGPDSTSVTATLTSSETYTVTGYSAEGCWDTIMFTVVVTPGPVAVITPDGPTAFCEGDSVILIASGGASFLWSNTSNSSSITVNTSGTYTVTATDTSGCVGSASETVTVYSLPAAVISPAGPVLVCSSSPAVLSANAGSGYTYQWYHNSTALAGETDSTLTVSVAGDYTVQITDSNGCAATSAPVQVLEGLGPDVIVTASPGIGCLSNTIYIGYGPQSITLTAVSSTAVSYEWSTGENTQSISVNTSNTYSVTAYDANGCPSLSTPESQITINVIDIRCGQGKKKILLCHVPEGNPSNPQTICVAPSAIPYHLDHHQYDCLGPCSLYYPRVTPLMGDEPKILLYPNPFSNTFIVALENDNGEPILLNIYDVTGRIILSDYRITETSELGAELNNGVYSVEILIGSRREMFRIVKL